MTAEDCAGWTKAIRTQVVYVVPGPFDPRGKGFWYNAIQTGKYTTSQLQTLVDYTNVASDVWGTDASRNRYGALTVARARDLLNYSATNPDMELKMEGHLLALWFNMVSGRLAVKKAVNVSTVSGWPTVMDDIGGNPLTFAYKVALEIEEKVNRPKHPSPSTAWRRISPKPRTRRRSSCRREDFGLGEGRTHRPPLPSPRRAAATYPAPERYNQDGDSAISILDLTRMAQVFIQPVSACP